MKKFLRFPIVHTTVIVLVILFFSSSVLYYGTNLWFLKSTDRLFTSQVQENTLNMHYTLANPEAFGISSYNVSLGSASPQVLVSSYNALEDTRASLQKFPRFLLSSSNRLTWDILDCYLDNEIEGKDYLYYPEPLGPTLGTQAQLPVLLAEYTFSDKQDVEDYLRLLAQMDTYYQTLLDYEKAKSDAGLFMSDALVTSIISQCNTFLASGGSLFLTTFQERMENLPDVEIHQKQLWEQENQRLVEEHVLPAYRLLIDGLNDLKGTGVNAAGLYYFPQGQKYYEYLVGQTTGCDYTIPQLQKLLQEDMRSNMLAMTSLIQKNPSLLNFDLSAAGLTRDPSEILVELQSKMLELFPAPPQVSFTVKNVDSSLEDYLSPAFYLTPPLDNLTSNVIYVNQIDSYDPLSLYTTLAHEGYPGHLYQTTYSGAAGMNPVRSLLNFGGYIEGWATYVEMYAYSFADTDSDLAELYRLNRALSLGLSCSLDIAIHYYGYTLEQVREYLKSWGYTDPSFAASYYNLIVEAPANYLKYYIGCLNFQILRDKWTEKNGADSLIAFHQKVLETGPAPFSVLEKYVLN